MPSLQDESIKRREVLFANVDGMVAFPGWAVSVTSIGTMFEPFDIGMVRGPDVAIEDFDPSEPMCRVDAMIGMNSDSLDVVHYDNGSPLHGGVLLPRTFKKSGSFTV